MLLLFLGGLSCFVPFPIIYRLASTERCLVFDRDQQFVFCILFSCFCKVLLLIRAFLVGSEEKSLIQYITRFFMLYTYFFFVYFLEIPLSIECTTLINNKPKSCLWLLRVKHPAMLPVAVYDQSRIFDIRLKPKFSFLKIRPSAEGIKVWSFVNFNFVECIKYNLLDFCNYLLVTANFPLENNRVLLWWLSVVTTL